MKTIQSVCNKIKISPETILLSCIILLGLFLRFYHLGKESFWLDESYTASLIIKNPGEIIQIAANDVYPPLFYLFLHGLSKVIKVTELTLRIPSAVFGTLSILVLWKFGKSLFTSKVALLAIFFLAISPFHIRYSQEVRAYSLLLFVFLCSCFFLYYLLQQKPTAQNFLGYFLSILIAIWSHVIGVAFVGMQILWIFSYYCFRNKKITVMKPIVLAIFLAGVSYIPWINVLLSQILKIDQGNFWLTKTTWVDLGSYLLLASGSIAGSLIVVPLFLYFSIIWIKKKDTGILIYWALGIPLVTWIVSILFVPFFTVRNMLPALPAFYLLLALILISIKYKPVALSLTVIFCISSVINLYSYYTVIQKDQWREAAIFLEENLEKNSQIYFDAPYGFSGLAWYSGNELLQTIDEPSSDAWLVLYSINSDDKDQYLVDRDVTEFKNITVAHPIQEEFN